MWVLLLEMQTKTAGCCKYSNICMLLSLVLLEAESSPFCQYQRCRLCNFLIFLQRQALQDAPLWKHPFQRGTTCGSGDSNSIEC